MDFRSRIVAFFKVFLPLAALAILATLFLLSRSIDPTTTIPFAEKEMADRLRSQQVTAPFFSGTTPKGDEIIVTATLARPGGNGAPAEAKDLAARITFADGVRITLNSDTGSIDPGQDMATFSGNVRIWTTTDLIVHSDALNTSLHAIEGHTPGTVTASGPLGDLTAGRMEFSAKNSEGPVHMLFKNGVKLVYDPKRPER